MHSSCSKDPSPLFSSPPPHVGAWRREGSATCQPSLASDDRGQTGGAREVNEPGLARLRSLIIKMPTSVKEVAQHDEPTAAHSSSCLNNAASDTRQHMHTFAHHLQTECAQKCMAWCFTSFKCMMSEHIMKTRGRLIKIYFSHFNPVTFTTRTL